MITSLNLQKQLALRLTAPPQDIQLQDLQRSTLPTMMLILISCSPQAIRKDSTRLQTQEPACHGQIIPLLPDGMPAEQLTMPAPAAVMRALYIVTEQEPTLKERLAQ